MTDYNEPAQLFGRIARSYGTKTQPGPRDWNAFGAICFMIVNGAADPVTGFYAYGFNTGNPPCLGEKYDAAKCREITHGLKQYTVTLQKGFQALAVENHPADFSSPQLIHDRIVEGALAARYLDFMVTARNNLLAAADRDKTHRPNELSPSMRMSEGLILQAVHMTSAYAALKLVPPGDKAINYALAANLASRAAGPLQRCNQAVFGIAAVANSLVFHG